MTLSQAMELLVALRQKHGDVEVYFDCPNCKQSFAPTTVVAIAAHLSEVKPK